MARYYRPRYQPSNGGNQMSMVSGILTLQSAKELVTEADAVALASSDANVQRLARAVSKNGGTAKTVGMLNLLGGGDGGSSGAILALAVSGGI